LSAIAAILFLALAGAVMLIGGTYVLVGHGFALLVGGVLSMLAAVILRSGLMPNG
jgi:hypothetical protein